MKLLPILILLLLLAGCSAEKTEEFDNFLDKKPQSVSERVISPLPEPDAVLNFTDFEVYSPGALEQNSTHLFSIDFGTLSIAKVSKESFSTPEVLSYSEGSGPGELQAMRSIAVSDDRIYAGDPRQLRLTVTDTDGNLIKDINTSFSPNNLYYIDDSTLLNYNAHQQDHLFTLYNISDDNTGGFEEITFGFDEVMKYSGYLSVDAEYIFFAGYSEPLLRKYSQDGKLLFSRSTIDNYDTSDHYITRTMGEYRAAGFSDDAKYSSLAAARLYNRFLVIPHHNGQEEFKYIDVYDAEDGSYLKTFSVDYYPRNIILDDDYLYLLARDGDDRLLLRYQNSLVR